MKKTRLRHIASYMIPVIAALAVFLGVELLTLRITQAEVRKNAHQTADYFASSVNPQLISIESYSYELLNLQLTESLAQLTKEQAQDSNAIRMGIQLANHVRQRLYTSDILDNVIFYFPKMEMAVSAQGYLKIEQLLFLEDLQLYRNEEGLEERFQSLFQSQVSSFFTVFNNSTGKTECYYSRRSPFNASMEECDRLILIRIDDENICRLMDTLAEANHMQKIALITPEGNVFAQSGYVFPHGNSVEDPAANPTMLEDLPSSMTPGPSLWGMTLYYAPTETASQTFIQTVLAVLSVGLVIAAASGLLLALYGHRRSASRLSRAKMQLGAPDEVSLEEAISGYLENARSQATENMQKLEQQQVLIRYSFLKDLLGHNDSSDSTLENLFSVYNVEFDFSGFSLFAVSSQDKNAANMDHGTILQYLSVTDFESITVFWTQIDELHVFLLGYEDSTERAAVEQIYSQLADLLTSKLYGNCSKLGSVPEVLETFRTLYQIITGKRFVSFSRLTPMIQEIYGQLQDAPVTEDISQQEQRQVAAQVVEIIAKEYANSQLSLSILASRLGVTQSYLSRAFKQKYGENISHYLSRTRIEHAKKLIQSGSDNLNTIALSVGFLSDMNLIRVFKRLENETPGNFRKKHKPN